MKDFTSRLIDGIFAHRRENDRELEELTERVEDPNNPNYDEDVAKAVKLVSQNSLLMEIASYLHKKEDENIKKIFRE
jgi:hypothetical protein